MELTTEQILQDALIAHKFLVSMYCQYGLECSNKTLRALFSKHHDMVANQNFKIFQIMNEKDLYPLIPATPKDITKAYKMHNQMQSELETTLQES